MQRQLIPFGMELPQFPAGRFRLEPMTPHHLKLDFENLMTADPNWYAGRIGPPPDLADMGDVFDCYDEAEELLELYWHEREAKFRTSFAYIAIDPETDKAIGNCYIYDTHHPDFEVEAYSWGRIADDGSDWDPIINKALREWLSDSWPFTNFVFPGRDIPWADWPLR